MILPLPVFHGDLMLCPINMRQQCCPAGIRAPACTLESLPTVFNVSLQVPYGTIGIATFITLVLLLSMHFHKVLKHTAEHKQMSSSLIYHIQALTPKW